MLVATAGHIDHGKTSLVRALTGQDTDRLPEERARGISIDLGFAHWRSPRGLAISFVDVPGHERFVRNMLAGVGAVDFALLVIAADDGVMPQTIEHVQILDLLGITRGIAVVTKCDRASRERIDEVRGEISRLLAPTSLASIAIQEVSSTTGAGIAQLGEALASEADREAPHARPGRNPRLAIDRSFSISGAGTVVTGTLIDGVLETGAQLVISPRGLPVRVRGLQNASSPVTQLRPGQRCAVNLTGAEVADARRGDWLVVPSMQAPTSRIEAALKVLATSPQALKHNATVHVHIGTADSVARVLVPRQAAVAPGSEVIVQLVFDHPICAVTGDRFVVRDPPGRHTLGGGRVINAFVAGDRRRQSEREWFSAALQNGEPSRALADLLACPDHEVDTLHFERSFNLEPEVAREQYQQAGAIVLDGVALPAERFESMKRRTLHILTDFHRKQPEAGGMSVRDLRMAVSERASPGIMLALQKVLIAERLIEMAGPAIKLRGHVAAFSETDNVLWQAALPYFEQQGNQPVVIRELAARLRVSEPLLRTSLFRRRASGEVWNIANDRFMLRRQVAALAAVAASVSREAGKKGFTAAEYRDAIGTGRTLAIQVLEFFDDIGVTRRDGNLRWVRPDYEQVVGR
jgi:selenocysteine-specific elongation factor